MESMISPLRDHRAFSLVELLLYVGILGIVGGLLTGILTTTTKTQVQQASQDKLSGELAFAMQTIQRLVQSSSLIDMNGGTTSSTLKLRTENLAQDPTLIYLSNGTVYIQQGSSTPQALTDGAVSVSSLQFQKFSQYPGKDVVQIDIAMSDANQSGALARSLRSAISRASAATFDSPLLPGGTFSIGTTANTWTNGYFSGTVGIASGGLLGIGTLTPSYPLDLEVANNGIFVSSTATTTNYSLLNLQAGTTTAFYVRNDGNIGIGTSTPAYGLDIYDTFHVANNTSTFDGNIVLGGASPTYRISNVASPATSTDVATKGYVDGLTAGGGIPAGYSILGSSSSAAPSGYTFSSNVLATNLAHWNTSMTPVPYSVRYHAVALGPDGLIYVMGGYGASAATSTVEAFNPSNNTWTLKASLPANLYYGAATTGADGLIYFAGGYVGTTPTSTLLAYNTSNNTWTQKASLPYTVYYHSMATGSDGLIYVIGGLGNSSATSTVEAYNPSNNTWTQKASLPVANAYGTAVAASDGLIYSVGGNGSTGVVYAYNPSTNSWATDASIGSTVYYNATAIGPDGLIYLVGTTSATTTVRTYNTITNSWSTSVPFPFAVYSSVGETGADGLTYFIGGGAGATPTSTVARLDQTFFKVYTKN